MMSYSYQEVTDMGILADVAYSEYGGVFIDYGETITGNEDNSFILSASYEVVCLVPCLINGCLDAKII